jgi:hypothetical protein
MMFVRFELCPLLVLLLLAVKFKEFANLSLSPTTNASVFCECPNTLQLGITLTEMEAKYPGDLFQKGLDRGDFWLDTEDGLYYTRSKKKRRTLTHTEKQEASQEAELKDKKQFLAVAAEMKTAEIGWIGFAITAGPPGPPGGPGDSSSSAEGGVGGPPKDQELKMADDKLTRALQDSFDATTRLTLDVKKAGQELMACMTITASGTELVKQAIMLCRNLVEPMNSIEELLLQPMITIRYQDGVDVLKKATKPFRDLQMFQQELLLLHKMYCKKGKAAACP